MLSGHLCARIVQADIREGQNLGRGAAYSLYGLNHLSRVQLSTNDKVLSIWAVFLFRFGKRVLLLLSTRQVRVWFFT